MLVLTLYMYVGANTFRSDLGCINTIPKQEPFFINYDFVRYHLVSYAFIYNRASNTEFYQQSYAMGYALYLMCIL